MNIIRILERHVRRAGSQKRAAEELGISAQYLNDLLQGRREPSDNVLEKLGLKWKIARAKA
jgi:transcriptional regulator with XRE-family HTH domain